SNGVSRANDLFDFWSGKDGNRWNNEFLHPLNWRKEFLLDERIATTLPADIIQNYLDGYLDMSLQIADLNIFNWRTDVFGNHYVLLKERWGSIAEGKESHGSVFIRNVYNFIQPAPILLENVFAKY